jgi:hypothetical protein
MYFKSTSYMRSNYNVFRMQKLSYNYTVHSAPAVARAKVAFQNTFLHLSIDEVSQSSADVMQTPVR